MKKKGSSTALLPFLVFFPPTPGEFFFRCREKKFRGSEFKLRGSEKIFGGSEFFFGGSENF